ncbi:MAG: TVP38/TMEM64 family protein [Proteobacteria bacterium]|nr:MAG: TVP38/TMEM64 family protein [Pseudomonadota bacterium]
MTAPLGEDPAIDAEAAPPARRARGGWLRIALAVAALAALVLLGRRLGAALPAFAAWVEGLGALGPIAFVAGYALAVVAFAPGSILTLAAGAIFGIARGTLYVFVAATLGASLAFLVARYAARPWVERRLAGNPRFAAIDRAVAQQGRRIVFLLRLSPAFPFNLLNYALGLTRVRFADALVASIGMLPGTLLYVYYGNVGGELAKAAGGAAQRGPAEWAVLALGLVATIAVTTIVARIARRALDDATDAGAAASAAPGGS